MRTYHLRVLYPTSNKYETQQYYDISVEANSLDVEDGIYEFYDEAYYLIASYPITYTIITSVSSK